MKKELVASMPETSAQENVGLWPSLPELSALRAFHQGLDSREAVEQYLPAALTHGSSARGVLGSIRRRLIHEATLRHRDDLYPTLAKAGRHPRLKAQRLDQAIEALKQSPIPVPRLTDDVHRWLSPRLARILTAQGIDTFVMLTLRAPRLRSWWRSIPGLGATGARQIESFFTAHPQLTEKARGLVKLEQQDLIPWEQLAVPEQVNGSKGAFRAPRRSCLLSAKDDYAAVNSWLSLQESPLTQAAYRKEAERLMLWAILEQGKALSSLTTDDAIAYRTFLRNPGPKRRWIGPVAPRHSPQWRPFQGSLSPRSASYALSVISGLFRWLIEQRYCLANPFAGVRVKAGRQVAAVQSRAFTETEWKQIEGVAAKLERLGWDTAAARRLRFLLSFGRATGLRNSELVRARLGDIEIDEKRHWWLNVVGKGSKGALVAIPPVAKAALRAYLRAQGLPTTQNRWDPDLPIVGRLWEDGTAGPLSSARLWSVMKRFFKLAAKRVESTRPALAAKLCQASPHWMRHTHATHALAHGAALTTVRDNLRHASVSTTSIYLHTDQQTRARQMVGAFGSRRVAK